jgi:hypothetical protein
MHFAGLSVFGMSLWRHDNAAEVARAIYKYKNVGLGKRESSESAL